MKLCTRLGVLLVASATLGLGGCTSYYMVKDPAGGSQYYTTSVKRSHNVVTFKDAKTSADVTLQSSQVQEITKDQYQSAVGSH